MHAVNRARARPLAAVVLRHDAAPDANPAPHLKKKEAPMSFTKVVAVACAITTITTTITSTTAPIVDGTPAPDGIRGR